MAYKLIRANGREYESARPGAYGGHRRGRGYGRLDCPAALHAIARGGYVQQRVFFADEATAIAAGYRPCGRCLPERYAVWRDGRDWSHARWRSLRVEPPFDAAHALAYLAARAIPGGERISDDGVYRRTLALPHGPAVIELQLAPDRATLRLPACDARDRREAAARARRLLGLDQDLGPAQAALAGDPHLGPLIRARPGLRVPGAADDFELLIRAIVHQQVSLAAARTVLGRLVEQHGKPLRRHHRDRLFPTRAALAALDPDDLPMPRARARAIVAAARAGTEDVETIPGVGPWTASYFAMRARRDPDAFPQTDLGLRRALESLGNPDPERWRPFRAYAAQHLWASALR